MADHLRFVNLLTVLLIAVVNIFHTNSVVNALPNPEVSPVVVPQQSPQGPQEGPVKALFGCLWDTYRKPRPEDIHFYLYTKKNKYTPKELFIPKGLILNAPQYSDVDNQVLQSVEVGDVGSAELDAPIHPNPFSESLKPLNPEVETKVLIHGFLQSSEVTMFQDMKKAFLKKGDYNIIIMDWKTFSSNCYAENLVIKTLTELGRLLAGLLDGLIQRGVPLESIHLIGFSLGAHLAGHAGSNLRSGKVGRITGLDPAAPLIKLIPELSLDINDANLVDIIHTSTDFGQPEPMGHVDFYPNNGESQPGCFLIECSHGRAVAYFTESINSAKGFWGTSCPSWEIFQQGLCSENPKAIMGEPFRAGPIGKFYLVTRPWAPYARG